MKVQLNPDDEYVKELRTKLKANGGYCPCVLEKSKDTKCMCKEFKEQIDRGEIGYCHCGLYQSVE